MNIRELSVEPREAVGKGAVGRLRREGLVPAILYGGGSEPVRLAVKPTDVHRALHGHDAGGVLVNIRLPGDAEPRTAVVRELQYDPVRDTLIHVDFQAVRMDEEISVEVPIHVVGEAAGVKEQSGVLALLLRAVEVSCLPSLIPGADRRGRLGPPDPRRGDRRRPSAARGRPRDDACLAAGRDRRSADGGGSRGRRPPRRPPSPRSSRSASRRRRKRPRARTPRRRARPRSRAGPIRRPGAAVQWPPTWRRCRG